MPDQDQDRLPLNSLNAWIKVLGILFFLLLINVVAAMVSFMWGVIITIPLTLFLAFLLLRDLLPRHRLPPGAPRQGYPT